MFNLKPIYIEATDIPDAWFQCLYQILDYGREYTVNEGSFVGHKRLQFDHVTIYIKQPYSEPYTNMLPKIPEHLNIPSPVDEAYLNNYLPYLLTDIVAPNEAYTYGQRITAMKHGNEVSNQLKIWRDRLKKNPGSNQVVIQIARQEDCWLTDPPCLREIGIQIHKNTLVFYPSFRSWDLWAGLPSNLAAIAIMQKMLADEIEIECGPMICTSKGLHLYDYSIDFAKIRTLKDNPKYSKLDKDCQYFRKFIHSTKNDGCDCDECQCAAHSLE